MSPDPLLFALVDARAALRFVRRGQLDHALGRLMMAKGAMGALYSGAAANRDHARIARLGRDTILIGRVANQLADAIVRMGYALEAARSARREGRA